MAFKFFVGLNACPELQQRILEQGASLSDSHLISNRDELFGIWGEPEGVIKGRSRIGGNMNESLQNSSGWI
jgi:hypothetical protein